MSPKLRYWKLKEQTDQKEFERVSTSKVNALNSVAGSMEEYWNPLKTIPIDTSNETCRKMKEGHHKRVTWWWNDEVNLVIVEKRQCWKPCKQGTSKEQYLEAKRNTKRTVHTAKKTADVKKFSDLKPGMNGILKISEQLRSDNQDVVGDKSVKDDSGSLLSTKKVAWKQHYKRFLNEEFSF